MCFRLELGKVDVLDIKIDIPVIQLHCNVKNVYMQHFIMYDNVYFLCRSPTLVTHQHISTQSHSLNVLGTL